MDVSQVGFVADRLRCYDGFGVFEPEHTRNGVHPNHGIASLTRVRDSLQFRGGQFLRGHVCEGSRRFDSEVSTISPTPRLYTHLLPASHTIHHTIARYRPLSEVIGTGWYCLVGRRRCALLSCWNVRASDGATF